MILDICSWRIVRKILIIKKHLVSKIEYPKIILAFDIELDLFPSSQARAMENSLPDLNSEFNEKNIASYCLYLC